jgi:hypothetical protein
MNNCVVSRFSRTTGSLTMLQNFAMRPTGKAKASSDCQLCPLKTTFNESGVPVNVQNYNVKVKNNISPVPGFLIVKSPFCLYDILCLNPLHKRQGFLTFHIAPTAKVPYLRPPNFVHIGPTYHESSTAWIQFFCYMTLRHW